MLKKSIKTLLIATLHPYLCLSADPSTQEIELMKQRQAAELESKKARQAQQLIEWEKEWERKKKEHEEQHSRELRELESENTNQLKRLEKNQSLELKRIEMWLSNTENAEITGPALSFSPPTPDQIKDVLEKNKWNNFAINDSGITFRYLNNSRFEGSFSHFDSETKEFAYFGGTPSRYSKLSINLPEGYTWLGTLVSGPVKNINQLVVFDGYYTMYEYHDAWEMKRFSSPNEMVITCPHISSFKK